ncbi:hypothetical protein QA640_07555 [Bradyrhizobium sp. CB82]|uniref:hypothetical protein n=1 Tax=Bradyrhizobium sp. CB82 TaxID=3039159 RepID=UPI0024B145A6|nr:hypothetical protein [Bradyrhizobium sp. CB82]WFU42313.1 hypothetical protein QA640_07555 [Bradyrhizobium sp. CB82]
MLFFAGIGIPRRRLVHAVSCFSSLNHHSSRESRIERRQHHKRQHRRGQQPSDQDGSNRENGKRRVVATG